MDIFLTWMFSTSVIAWFIYPLCITFLLLAIHYSIVRFRHSYHLWFYNHLIVFFVLNLMFFMLFMETKATTPSRNWFIWPTLSLSLPVVIHYSLHYHPKNWFRLHVGIFINCQLLFFFTWAALDTKLPWWVFPLVVWGVLVYVHSHYSKPPPEVTLPADYDQNLDSTTFGTLEEGQIQDLQAEQKGSSQMTPVYTIDHDTV